MTDVLCAVVAGMAGGVCAATAVLAGMLHGVKPYVARRLVAERARYAALDRGTWRTVRPELLGPAPGTAARIAGCVQAELPAGVLLQCRARDAGGLSRGVVRVSIEAGTKEEES